jgi:uncharacterized protein YcfJ
LNESNNLEIDMNHIFKTAVAVVAIAISSQAVAQVIFYENEGYTGRSFNTERRVDNFQEYGFNDRASSVVVLRDLWEVCEDARYGGRCAVLRPGRYPSLSAMGLNDRVSSVRTVNRNGNINNDRYAPPTEPIYDNHRRNNERLYEANVTSMRAVVGPPERRCWIDREQAIQERGDNNIPAAIVGALIGGVLGHQIGGGHGQDIATAGGAVAGAVVGSNTGRGNNRQPYTRDVERCTTEPSRALPQYWDVTYNFRGIEHRIQTAVPPGATVIVNRRGEPRA